MASKQHLRQIVPQKYLTASLDVSMMKSLLATAPLWRTDEAEKKVIHVALPMPDGSFQRFRIVEAPVMHPDLQARYPDIRSYAGQGIDDPLAYFRGDFTPRGFHGMVRSAAHSTVFIDPYSTDDIVNYQVYYKKDFIKNEPWQCGFEEAHQEQQSPAQAFFIPIGDCQLRDYTLALACTGEYATFHGGTKPLVLAAFNTSMTRVNGVYEKDCAIHMTLHPNTDLLIFLVAGSDPYTNTNGGTMLGQNQTTCDAVIGNANYDIGHVFSTGGGGVAYLGSVCNSGNKAGGVTGSSAPVGDAYDIDYVAHEMGHQFGGNHTFNSNLGSCSGNQNNSTAMEPGSGTTIMAYAGICSTHNIQAHSDDYFHAISQQEIAAEVTSNGTGGGNTCSTNITINTTPTADAGADYVIPKSTPFILTGVGTDPNGDPMTYTWEQMDNATATMPPLSTNTGGPAFRSFKGTTSPSRYVPRLTDVVNNVSPTWEVLPSVARTLNWRLVVRDNHMGGGCSAKDDMLVTVNGTAGPFLVTAPNTGVSWQGASQQTVTWNVAGTTASPVSCANVDIFLSTDGGLTYPTVLATATPNDGTQVVTLPNVASTTARIMVKANGNIFYDISNTNFTITLIANSFTLNVSPTSPTVCSPTSAVYNITVGVVGTFSGNVTLGVTGLPAGAMGTFSTNPVSAPGTSNLTVTTAGVATGTYNLSITGTNGATTRTSPPTLTVLSGTIGQVALSTPTNGATGVLLTPTLTWAAVSGAITYDVQVSTVPTFVSTVVNVTGATGTSYSVPSSLSTNTTYFWKVRAVNTCVTGAWATTYSFITYNTVCLPTLASTDVPKTISASGAPTVTSTLNVSGVVGNIVFLKVKNLLLHHTWIGDVKVTLTSPGNVNYVLFDRPGYTGTGDGCGNNHILATFDDAAVLTAAQFESTCNTSTGTTPPPYAINGTYQSVTLLAPLNGTSPNGTWTLTVQDFVNQDGGSLQGWSLEFLTNCEPVLNLTQTFIEGYMNSGAMRPVLLNSSVPGATTIQSDTITVALHASTAPYAQLYTAKTVLSTTGAAIAKFPTATAGNSYYIVVKGRNLLETWSANPVAFTATTSYIFGSATQAYGSNLGSVDGIAVIYSGNFSSNPINTYVGLEEYIDWETDFNNLLEGYILTDLDGDGFTGLSDYIIWETNFNNLIEIIRP